MYLEQISKNQGRLYGFIQSLHYYKNDIDDILQETNITLLNKEKDFDDTKDFIPWAFSIARFTLLNHKKKKAKEGKKLVYDTPMMDLVLELNDSELKEDLLYEGEEERLKLLNKIKGALTKKQAMLIEALLNGQSINDIAEEWGARPATIATLKTRTVRRIKDIVLKLKYSKNYDWSWIK